MTLAVMLALGVYVLTQQSPAHSDSTQLTGAATSVASQFAVFGQAATASDALPSQPTISGTIVRHIGPSGSAWASISNGALCVQDATGANICLAPGNYVGNPLVMAPGTSDVPERLVGLVPNGITSVTTVFSDGSSKIGTVTDNGFTVQAGKNVKELRWTTPDNVTHTQGW